MENPDELDRFGNFISENFIPEPRLVTPYGIVLAPNIAAVKLYHMVPYEGNISINMLPVNRTIKDKLESGEIKPCSGLGYAVLSEDVLNISMWDSGVDENSPPYVIHPNVYTFGEGRFDNSRLERKNVSEVGPFCAWEGDLFGHESLAWRRYLYSKRTNQDKLEYLQDFYQAMSRDYPYSDLQHPIKLLRPTSREYGLFITLGIKTVEDLMRFKEKELLNATNYKFGKKSLGKLRDKVEKLLGLKLKK